jgi:hypothetical protein
VAIKRGQDTRGIDAGERFHEHGRVPHVRRGAYLSYGHGDPSELRIVNFGVPKDIGQGVPQHFAHPQLPLRRAFLR